jgi:hypothetical protein
MDIFDPGTEVWICPCGAHRLEPGLCENCQRESLEPIDLSFFRILIAFIFILVCGGLIVAVGLMLHAAWLMHLTFSGGSR